MALFVARHRHSPEACPAGHPQMGPMLLRHLSPENARQYGVRIQAEAVLDGQHTLVLILEAESREQVERFLQPFAQVGTVEVSPASLCEAVVARQRC